MQCTVPLLRGMALRACDSAPVPSQIHAVASWGSLYLGLLACNSGCPWWCNCVSINREQYSVPMDSQLQPGRTSLLITATRSLHWSFDSTGFVQVTSLPCGVVGRLSRAHIVAVQPGAHHQDHAAGSRTCTPGPAHGRPACMYQRGWAYISTQPVSQCYMARGSSLGKYSDPSTSHGVKDHLNARMEGIRATITSPSEAGA